MSEFRHVNYDYNRWEKSTRQEVDILTECLRVLLKKIAAVAIDDLHRVGETYVKVLFDASKSKCAICCNPSKVDEIKDAFERQDNARYHVSTCSMYDVMRLEIWKSSNATELLLSDSCTSISCMETTCHLIIVLDRVGTRQTPFPFTMNGSPLYAGMQSSVERRSA